MYREKGVGTGKKVFALSVGYYSCLYDVPGKRFLMYREKGVGTGKKVFNVPGIKHFPKETNKYLSQVTTTFISAKGLHIKSTFSKISPSFRCWENNVVVTFRMFHIVCLYPAIFALFAGRSVDGDFLSFSIIFHKRVARERCDAILAQFT